MPYTVTSKHAGFKRREFDAYVRLLESRGIDWTNIPRVSEPGTSNKWLYVWADQNEAEAFRDELQKETRDENWIVRELPESVPESQGPLTPVIILAHRQSTGASFSLHPHSRTLIRRRFPQANMVSSVSIEAFTMQEFERRHGSIWNHIAQVLSGLTLAELEQIGGYQVVDVATDRILSENAAHATA